jgi:hypothetical protein
MAVLPGFFIVQPAAKTANAERTNLQDKKRARIAAGSFDFRFCSAAFH